MSSGREVGRYPLAKRSGFLLGPVAGSGANGVPIWPRVAGDTYVAPSPPLALPKPRLMLPAVIGRAMPNPNVRDAIHLADEVIGRMSGMTALMFDDGAKTAGLLRSMTKSFPSEGASALHARAEFLTSEPIASLVEMLIHAFEQRFFVEFLPEFFSGIQLAVRLMSESQMATGNRQKIRDAVAEAGTSLEFAKTCRGDLDRFSHRYGEFLGRAALAYSHVHMPAREGVERHIRRMGALVHDTGNVLAPIAGYMGMLTTDVEDFGLLLRMNKFDISELGAMFDSIAWLLAKELERSGVKFTSTKLKGRLFVPQGMQQALFRVIFELMTNGLRAVDPKKLEFEERYQMLDVSKLTEGRGIQIAVVDTGVGMTAEQVETVLTMPGTRLTPNSSNGTGNGVTGTVKELVERYGWRLNYESAPGEGTVATLTIPLDQFDALEEDVQASEPFSAGADSSLVVGAASLLIA